MLPRSPQRQDFEQISGSEADNVAAPIIQRAYKYVFGRFISPTICRSKMATSGGHILPKSDGLPYAVVVDSKRSLQPWVVRSPCS